MASHCGMSPPGGKSTKTWCFAMLPLLFTTCTITPRALASSALVPVSCRPAYSLRSLSGMSDDVQATSAGMVRNGTQEAAGMVLRARFSADSTFSSLGGHYTKKRATGM